MMDPKKTILKNIERKKPKDQIESPEFGKGVPLPSWIELSLIDACNRLVHFLS